ncbi:hypothetical protein ACJRO7_020713 [Eucalyptus globulus]|uniref:Uncharacterized protein n=2 Tax=Eucalyptus TaxID=3932 RepID=A0ABD3KNN1_EUCGL
MEAARELAEKKDIEALHVLSAQEVEKFMLRWNGDGHLRRDYERRILASLNQRGLRRDGRRNRNESPIDTQEAQESYTSAAKGGSSSRKPALK